MLRLPVIAASFAALALPLDAGATSVFAFDRASASPNERVKVMSALSETVRLYLVRHDVAGAVRSRNDHRFSFIGVIEPSGSLTFSLPPLDAGTYDLATWCGRCPGPQLRTRAARLQVLPVAGCPVTRPNGSRPPRQPRGLSWHGNGRLWAGVDADGTYSVPRTRLAHDGSIGNKLLWVTTPAWAKPNVSGERLDDAAPPLRVLGVNTGSFQSGDVDPSHMSAVSFPTPGCWRLTARVGDFSLTYVVQVDVTEG
jgi:hypothetical protein